MPEASLQMDKAHEASAPPPYYGEQAPPYPGNEPDNQYPGSYQQPPPAQYGPPPTQAAGYHQQPPPVQYTQVTPLVQPVVITQAGRMRYGRNPMVMTCMHCQTQIQTSIRKEQGQTVWIMAGVICGVGLFFGLCCLGLIPFCIDDLNRVEHTCPNCKSFLGAYN